MDASGTYGSVFGGNSQMQPGAPSANSEQYKVNVSRQKTRKWAQFKPQNYDGDDWGTDYDDAPEDTPPPLPAKPAGPRQPSTLPSSRQHTPTGVTPLHIQTQRLISSPTGPASAGGALEWTGIEQIVSPQSVVPQSAAATVSSVFTGTPLSAHPAATFPLRTKSPATPHSAGPVSARFSVRGSSIGAHDAPDPTDTAPQLTSAPRPDSRADARPASPAGVTSPTSPNKALPFIRPADIYKRMEEEKRQSMESGGRPSMDSITAGGRGDYNLTVQSEPADQKRSEEATSTSRSARPSLAPVAERKSEYGLEGLIASYGSDDAAEPTVEPAPWTQSQTSAAAAAPEQQRSRSSSPFSSSPKLPELGRMSGFGDDLFSSTPSRFLAGSSQKPSVPGAAQFSAVAPHSAMAPLSASAPAVKLPPQVSSGAEGAEEVVVQPVQPTTGIRSTSPPNDSDRSVGLPLQQGRANATQPASDAPQRQGPVAEASRLPTSSTGSKQTVQRPTLPGSWVTETPSTPGESATPAATGTPRRLARRAVESGEVSPLTEVDDNVEDSLAKTARSHKPTYDGINGGVNESSEPKQQISTGLRAGSPPALHPLRIGSPAVSTSKEMAPGPNASRIGDHEQTPFQPWDVKDHELTSPAPNTATTHGSNMTPIAPLNPNRNPHPAGIAEQHFIPPPSFDNGSTLDTTSSSPLKESDMLREEIIKSLSPMNPSNDFLDVTGGTTAAYHAAAGPVRESSYLTDVYGDYWAAPADKPAQAPVDSSNKNNTKRSTGAPTPPPIEADKHDAIPPLADAEKIQTSGSEEQLRDLRRRFSWEIAAEEEANAQRLAAGEQAERPASRPDVDSIVGAGPTSSLETEPATLSIPKPDNTSTPSPVPTGGISHQVSQASTLPPRLAADAPIEPPSPISVVSERNAPPHDSRRLSLAEQKSTMQSSSHPLSPTPPIEQHPAIVNEQYHQQYIPTTPIKKDIGSMISFRQIMELSTYSERINTYNETRQQFAAMDTGLDDWMVSMVSQHPEHGSASYSFKAGLMDPGVANIQQGSQVPMQVNVQTPYFQQHPNPSTTAFGQGPRLANNMPMPPTPQHSSGAFGHSGAQVSTKGKELFMAAGKAGKGLLSKGKSKLKGDKDDESQPPPVPAKAGRGAPPPPAAAARKVKGDRRASWSIGFSLGRRGQDQAPKRAALWNSANAANAAKPAKFSAPQAPLSFHAAVGQRHPTDQAQQGDQGRRLQFEGLLQKTSTASPPPQLPSLTRISSFDSSLSRLSSTVAHPHPYSHPPPTPPKPFVADRRATIGADYWAGRRSDSEIELVSPISDSLSARQTPAPFEPEPEPCEARKLHVPPPISKQQPSWNPYTGTPLVEEEGFDLHDGDGEFPATGSKAPPGALDNPQRRGSRDLAASTAQAQRGAAPGPSPEREATAPGDISDEPLDKNATGGNSANSDNKTDGDGNESVVVPAEHLRQAPSDLSQLRIVTPTAVSQLQLHARPASLPTHAMAAYAQNQNSPRPGNFAQQSYYQQTLTQQHQQQQQYQQSQQQQQQQQQPPSQSNPHVPQRSGSFQELPPIRRTSTFGSSLMLSPESPGGAFSSDDNSDVNPFQQRAGDSRSGTPAGQVGGAPPPADLSQPPSAPNQMAGVPHQFTTGPPPPGQFQNVYRPTHGPMPGVQGQQYQGQGQPFAPPQPGFQQHPMQSPPQPNAPGQPGVQGPPRSFSGSPANPQPMTNAPTPPPGQGQQFPVMGRGGGRGVMMPPHMMANQLQRFPPQGGNWNLQESHLSEPLNPTNRHRSNSSTASVSGAQPFYGYDKEAGVPSTSGLSPQREKTQEPKEQPASEPRPLQSQHPDRSESPSTPRANQALPNSQQTPPGRPPGGPLSRSETDQSEMLPPSSIHGGDEGRRRQSGIFSSIQRKFTGGISDDARRDSFGRPRFQGQVVTSDEVSEASVVTEDTSAQKKRNPFARFRSIGQAPENMPPHSQESIIAHSPGTPLGQRMQPSPGPQSQAQTQAQWQSQFPPPEQKPAPYFSTENGSAPTQQPNPERADLPRASISSNLPGETRLSINGGGQKKGFSVLMGKFRAANPEGSKEGPRPPGTSASVNSFSVSQGQLMQPNGLGHQEDIMPSSFGRERSGSLSGPPPPRPFTSGQASQISLPQYGSLADVDPGRKPTGGLFGFGRFMSRSEAKRAEPPAAAGRGQPGPPPPFGQQPRPGQPGLGRGQPGPVPGPMPGQQFGPSQQLGRGQLPPFAPRPGQFPGQLGNPTPLGPDGRPLIVPGQFHQQHPGQFVIMQPGMLPPGVQGPPNGQMVFVMPGQPMGSLKEEPEPPQSAGSQSAPSLPLPSQSQPTPQQGVPKPDAPTPPGSHTPQLESPASQRSQPVAVSPAEQTRTQTASPASLRQPVPGPQPGPPSQTAHPLPSQLRALNPSPPNQMVTRKPVSSSPRLSIDQVNPQPGTSEWGQAPGQRTPSIVSQVQIPPHTAQGANAEQAKRVSGPLASQSPPNGQRLSGQQQHSGPTPATSQISQPASVPGASPRPSVQGEALQGPPSQQPGQGQQGPGQTPPSGGQGQGSTPIRPVGRVMSQASVSSIASFPSQPSQPGQQPLPPSGLRQAGMSMAVPKEKEQSTFAKMKEMGAKSFFSNFRRGDPKQGVSQPQLQAQPYSPQDQSQGQAPAGQQGPHPMLPIQLQQTGPQPQLQQNPGMPFQGEQQASLNEPQGPNQGLVRQGTLPQQAAPATLQPLQPQFTGPRPLQPQFTGPQPIRPQFTGPQPLRPQMTGPQPMQPQFTGPQHLQRQFTGPQPIQPQFTGQQFVQPQFIQQRPQQQQQQQQQGRGNLEPQYAQVPIPAGYGYVRGEGHITQAPAPFLVSGGQVYALPPGQPLPPGLQQQWAQQGAVRPVWSGPAPGQQTILVRPTGPQDPAAILAAPPLAILQQGPPSIPQAQGPPQFQNQPGPFVNGANASQPGPVGQNQQIATPTPPQSVVSPQFSGQQAPAAKAPTGISTPNGFQPRPEYSHPSAMLAQENNTTPPPQSQQPAYPLPTSAFSPINPATIKLQNPQFSPSLPGQPRSGGGLVPQRQPSAVSQVSLQPGHLSQNLNSHISLAGQSLNTPSPQITPERAVSPEPAHSSTHGDVLQDSRAVSPEPPTQSLTFAKPPTAQAQPVTHDDDDDSVSNYTIQTATRMPAPSRSSLQVQANTTHIEENIYDATPRNSTVPPQYRESAASQAPTSPRYESAPNKTFIPHPGPAEPKSPSPPQERAAPRAPEPIQEKVLPKPAQPIQSIQNKPLPKPAEEKPEPAQSKVTPDAGPLVMHSNNHVVVAESSNTHMNGHDTPPKAASAERDIFEAAKRQKMLHDQEEKIPVFPSEPDMNVRLVNPVRKPEEELPQMTATSYPGQEWNPYGDGFEWDGE